MSQVGLSTAASFGQHRIRLWSRATRWWKSSATDQIAWLFITVGSAGTLICGAGWLALGLA